MTNPTTHVAHRTIDSPIGGLILAATDAGLVRLAFEGEGFDRVLETLVTRFDTQSALPSATERSAALLDQAVREIEEFFGGTRRVFEVPLDFRLSSGFHRSVQQFLRQIGYGETLTYKQVAEQVGNPNAVRAVGSACATNPLPVVVPCHRVLRSDGTLGGYAGGLPIKQSLLAMEQANLGDHP